MDGVTKALFVDFPIKDHAIKKRLSDPLNHIQMPSHLSYVVSENLYIL